VPERAGVVFGSGGAVDVEAHVTPVGPQRSVDGDEEAEGVDGVVYDVERGDDVERSGQAVADVGDLKADPIGETRVGGSLAGERDLGR
jgi:hypothetical protein